jgi:hypothetical protein
MSDTVDKYILEITADNADAMAKLKAFMDQGKNVDKQHENIFSKLKAGWIVVAAAIAAAGKVIVDGTRAFMEAELSATRLGNAMAATGQYTREAHADMLKFAEATMWSTGVTHEETEGLLAMAMNMGLTGEKAKEAVRGTIGLNASLGVDMTRALRGSVGALTGHTDQLTRALPELKNFGTDAEKCAYALDHMKSGFSQAQANMNTFAGQMKFVKNLSGEFQEILGEGIAKGIQPAITRFREFISTAEGMETLKGVARGIATAFVIAGAIITSAWGFVGGGIKLVIDQIKDNAQLLDDVFHGRWDKVKNDFIKGQQDLVKDGLASCNAIKKGVGDAVKVIEDIYSGLPPKIESTNGMIVKSNEGMIASMDKVKQEYKLLADFSQSAGKIISEGIGNKDKSAKEGWKDFLRSIVNAIAAQMGIYAAAEWALSATPPPLGGPWHIPGAIGLSAAVGAVEGLGNAAINSFAVGTPYVPYDQLAIIHRGEAIIPAVNNTGTFGSVTYNFYNNAKVLDSIAFRAFTRDIIREISSITANNEAI